MPSNENLDARSRPSTNRTGQGTYEDQCDHLSLAQKLPVELLTTIFSLYSPSLSVTHSHVFPTTLALSQTCSYWRQVVLSTPKLWSNLSLNLTYDKNDVAILVDLHLARSEPLPLTLRVDGSKLNDHGEQELVNRLSSYGWSVLMTLFNAHTRWSNASFNLHWDVLDVNLIDSSVKLNASAFPILHTLSVSWQNDRELRISNRLFHIWHNLPVLQSLQIDSYLPYFPFNLNTLSKIVVTKCRLCAEVRFLLARCKNLSDATFTMDAYPDDADLDVDVFPVNTLHSLTLNFTAMEVGCNLLSSLTLPRLTTLDLSSQYGDVDQMTLVKRVFRDMLSRSSCQLTELRLTGRFGTDLDLIEILSMTPTVISLALNVRSAYGGYVTDKLFEMLSFDSTVADISTRNEAILPCLARFHLTMIQSDGSTSFAPSKDGYTYRAVLPALPDPKAILSMVQSRFSFDFPSGRTRLECFALSVSILLEGTRYKGNDWAQLFGSTAESSLRALARDGLQLELNIKEGPAVRWS
ncbi:hypothetical protein VKT23_006841 [Stygiomarasmius scandens]|uniref:F-box domain-containing protein n=1 Tax=Marasmiellus scandens TaxID=2682957 RepID=A0ABR1JQR1_9AGAR